MRSSIEAFAGGTPIMDVLGDWPLCDVRPLVQKAVRRSHSVVFVGVGIEGLRSDKSRTIVKNDIAPNVLHWSVRCQQDERRLLELAVPAERVTVAADMAWLMRSAGGAFGEQLLKELGVDAGRALIGVSLVNENACFDRQTHLGPEIACALDRLIDELDAQVIFLAQEVRDQPEFDRAAALRVSQLMARKDQVRLVPNTYFSPQQIMSVLGHCVLTIGMRYHFCIFSALQNVPFIAIQRSDKVADLCWDMDWQAAVTPATLNASAVVEVGLRLRSEWPVVSAHLHSSVGQMKERALRNVAPLNLLMSETGYASLGAGTLK
jgi:polysaccharide pyruvyl transferase WcaK-like protein